MAGVIAGLVAGFILFLTLAFWILSSNHQIRRAVVGRFDPDAYKTVTIEDKSIAAKAGIYTQIAGLSRARAIRVLNDITRELLAGDPKLSTTRAQMLVPDLAKVAEKLSVPDFMFLLSSALDQSAYNQLLIAEQPGP